MTGCLYYSIGFYFFLIRLLYYFVGNFQDGNAKRIKCEKSDSTSDSDSSDSSLSPSESSDSDSDDFNPFGSGSDSDDGKCHRSFLLGEWQLAGKGQFAITDGY